MRNAIVFLMLVWLVCPGGWSQVYNVTRYSTEDGLPQSQVRAMFQDRDGYLWLGTRGGVSKFDGQQFHNFTAQQHNGLVGDFIIALYEDAAGNVWIGSERGLSRFDGRTFTNFTHEHGLMNKEVLSIIADHEQNLWIGQKGGLVLFDGAAFSTKPISEQISVNALLYDSLDRHVWIGTNRGLYVCEDIQADLNVHDPFLPQVTVYCLLLSQDRHLWIGSNKGVFCYKNAEFIHYDAQTAQLPDNTVYTLCQDKSGQIWAGTEGGVAYFSDDGWKQLKPGNRPLPNVRSSTVDLEGNIWLGLDGGGIRKLTRGVFQKFNVEDGMSSNIAKSFLEDEKGDIWISTYDNGISIYDGANFRQLDESDGLAGNNISYSFKDSRGRMWFATYSDGLSSYVGGKFRNYSTADGLKSDSVYCVYEDRTGRLWIGTEHGISIYDKQGFTTGYTPRDGLIDETVYAIHQDHEGNMWIGTPEGVSKLQDTTFINYGEAYIGHTVISILEDPRRHLWFATSEGLYMYADSSFRKIKISEAAGADNIVSLVAEGNDFLWVGTENGAYRLNLNTFDPNERNRFEHYTQKDGLPSLECNANAAFIDSKGNLWIGTTEGAIMRPANTERVEEDLPPILHITGVSLSLLPTDWDSLGYKVDPRTGLPIDLKLPYSQNRLDFTFIGISLKSPRQVEYKFMLEGLDESWSEETRQTRVSYTNLRPGKYTFRVISKKESTAWDERVQATYSFEILPPWYSRWWFILLMGLLVAAIGWGVYWRISLDRKKKLEEEHIKNTAEKLRLEHQALYAMMNPHFIFNALQSIQYFIHRQDRISANKFLSSFAKLMRKNLDSTKSDFISLQEEVDRLKLYLSLEKMRFPEKFEYEVRVDEDIDAYDTQLPPMILQPFVENSIKHGIMPLEAEGKIQVTVSRKGEDHLLIRIIDNGIGIEASQTKKANRPSDHVSKGMQITLDRLALFARMTHKEYAIDIREIKNPDGSVAGTQVELLLPLHH